MDWEIMAVYYTDLKLPFYDGDFSDAALRDFVEKAKARSLYNYDVPFEDGDKFVSLVTCTVKYGADNPDQRFVIMAKLLPEGATVPRQAALEVNPNPVQPQFD